YPPIFEERGRVERTWGRHIASWGECACARVINLGRRVRVRVTLANSTSYQDFAVRQQRGGVAVAGRCHGPGRGECLRDRVANFGASLGAEHCPVGACNSSGNEYPAVQKQGRRVQCSWRDHGASGLEGAW